jgi:cyclophilin family peptidyl-prolyl cis-trans isomerase
LKAPSTGLAHGSKPVAVVQTSCGTFEISLDVARSPKTASSFAYLVRKGVYDRTFFHRIVPGFVIQGGDPEGTGTGGPGYSVTEAPPQSIAYHRGVVAMAKTAAQPPGTSESQFYVVTAADAGLPPDYAYLGKVTRGLPVVMRIGRLGDRASGETGTPTQTVVIEKISLRGA